VSLEQHVPEKLHAYTGTFGHDERESTRVKDLVDLVLISESAEIDAKRLRHALATTFEEHARRRYRTPCRCHRRRGQDRTRC
jgi:Mn-dependent DtxR family transcriptional regulator